MLQLRELFVGFGFVLSVETTNIECTKARFNKFGEKISALRWNPMEVKLCFSSEKNAQNNGKYYGNIVIVCQRAFIVLASNKCVSWISAVIRIKSQKCENY